MYLEAGGGSFSFKFTCLGACDLPGVLHKGEGVKKRIKFSGNDFKLVFFCFLFFL